MTKRLESLFGLPLTEETTAKKSGRLESLFQSAETVSTSTDIIQIEEEPEEFIPYTEEEAQEALVHINTAVDKIEAALPMVTGLDTGDEELDEIANRAIESFESLSDLGYNVDSRFASEIFAVAGTMLGHALSAKTAKLNKKMKMIDLQLKKAKFEMDKARKVESSGDTPFESGQAQIISRNDLLDRILATKGQSQK